MTELTITLTADELEEAGQALLKLNKADLARLAAVPPILFILIESVFIDDIAGKADFLAEMRAGLGDSDSPFGYIAPKPEAEPLGYCPSKLLDGWLSPEHKQFYREALSQARKLLRDAAQDS